MKNTEVHLYIPESLKVELKKEASEKNLTLSTYIRMLLSERKK